MPQSRSRGFTLVEVLVATGILVTAAAGTAQLFAIAIHHDIAARQQLGMSLAASSKLEELAASVAAGPMPASSGGAVDRVIPGFIDSVQSGGASFQRRWLIAPLAIYSGTAVAIVVRVIPVAGNATADFEIATIRQAATP